MADLTVQPSYQLKETDILTVDKINLMATPIVSLSIETPVNDQNYVRNGNFYSAFWTTPGGVPVPPAPAWVSNASYWLAFYNGVGPGVTYRRSSDTPDIFSLFSAQLVGAAGTTGTCRFGQQINGDLSATLRRPCTFSGYIENNTGAAISPILEFYTPDQFNNFTSVAQVAAVDLQTCPNGQWTFVSATVDVSTFANAANGLFVIVAPPAGIFNTATSTVNFSRLKFQIGELATEFSDDPSLFVQAPSVDSTMLQDGCLARPSLYVTNPGVIPKGAFAAGAIRGVDIGTGEVKAVNLDPGISTTTSANFTVPAVNANVAITLTTANQISTGLLLNIQGAGSYSTVSVAGNVVTAQNTGAAGNAAPGIIINSGASVTTTGNAVIGGLGYTPVNKAGDTMTGALKINYNSFQGVVAPTGDACWGLACNNTSNPYIDSFTFIKGPIDDNLYYYYYNLAETLSRSGRILDSSHGVDNASYQAGSITIDKLAQSLINIIVPPGMIRMYAGPGSPPGWLLCDGSIVAIATYPALHAAIGNYWGAGDGSGNNFNLPDFRGRSPLGYVFSAAPGITPRAFAERGGEETHVLSVNELAYHDHTLTDLEHTHGLTQTPHAHTYVNPLGGFSGQQGSTMYSASGTANSSQAYANITVNNAPSNISLAYTGANYGHNNMQPYSVLSFIVKT